MQNILQYCTLGNWLLLVASLRLLSVYMGYVFPKKVLGHTLESQVFDRANNKSKKDDENQGSAFTSLSARTFAVWTAVTCLVCIATSRQPENQLMLLLCLSTFVIAFVYFMLELFVYKTVSVKTVSRPAFFASKYQALQPLSLVSLDFANVLLSIQLLPQFGALSSLRNSFNAMVLNCKLVMHVFAPSNTSKWIQIVYAITIQHKYCAIKSRERK